MIGYPSGVLGILGNIEQTWIDSGLPKLVEKAKAFDYRLLMATSNNLDLSKFTLDRDLEHLTPWLPKDTDKAFEKCEAILVPLSKARLVYSSPSKIIDCYMRGIQPIIITDPVAWEQNKNRFIYQCCVTEDEFFETKKRFSAEELKLFSLNWIEQL